MIGFLGEIGSKLADRWAASLVVPGLLYLAAATAAGVLGQGHALSYLDLSRTVDHWAAGSALKSVGGTVLVAAAVLAGSVATGLLAGVGGRVTEIGWTLPGRRAPARWLAASRRKRSRAAKETADNPDSTPEQVRLAVARADRICLIEASRPTWIGDRLRACRIRIERAYGIDLDTSWPRLWLIFPDNVRAELGTARDAFSAAARLTAWAVLYLLLGIWWWPAVAIALIAGAAAVVRARLATSDLADLIEASVDLYARTLAAQLDEPPAGPLTRAAGKALTARMRKSRWDPGSPLAD
jgi:hypothetical protein